MRISSKVLYILLRYFLVDCSVPCFLKKRSWPIIIFRLICSARSPQMKRSRRISFISKLVNSHFPVILTHSQTPRCFARVSDLQNKIGLSLYDLQANGQVITTQQRCKLVKSLCICPVKTNPLRIDKHHFQEMLRVLLFV